MRIFLWIPHKECCGCLSEYFLSMSFQGVVPSSTVDGRDCTVYRSLNGYPVAFFRLFQKLHWVDCAMCILLCRPLPKIVALKKGWKIVSSKNKSCRFVLVKKLGCPDKQALREERPGLLRDPLPSAVWQSLPSLQPGKQNAGDYLRSSILGFWGLHRQESDPARMP